MLGLAGAEEGLSKAEADARTARRDAESARAEAAALGAQLGSAEEARAAAAAELATLRAQSVESSRAQMAMIDTQLSVAKEQKAVRGQLVKMQELMLQGLHPQANIPLDSPAGPAHRTVTQTPTGTSAPKSAQNTRAAKVAPTEEAEPPVAG